MSLRYSLHFPALILVAAAGTAFGAAGDVVDVTALDLPPERHAYVPPAYPEALKVTREQGDVSLALVIGTDGRVAAVEDVKAPDPRLVPAVETAVRQWTFDPGFVGGLPVPYRLPVLVAMRPDGNPDGIVEQPTPEYRAAARYPAELQAQPRDGYAIINLLVDAAGSPSDAVVEVASHPAFAGPAREAILDWKFTPARKAEMLVSVRTLVKVRFAASEANVADPADLFTGTTAGLLDYEVAPEPSVPVPLIYPYDELMSGERGAVTLSVIVSPEGQVVRTNIDSATSPEFALSARACVAAWTFKPATKVGSPVYAQLQMQLSFSDAANELQYDEASHELLPSLRDGSFKPTSARELDTPLQPREQVRPRMPAGLPASETVGEALIQVIVDRNGRAQFPRIINATNPILGYVAATAAGRWRFEIPRRNDVPVDVRVRIPMKFSEGPVEE